jgi:hypothetical protein
LLAIAATVLPATAQAQSPLPLVDAEAIYQRLQQQDAAIQRLREQVSKQDSPPLVDSIPH